MLKEKRVRHYWWVLVVAVALAGCGAAPAQARLPEGALQFTADDGASLAGTVYGQGDTAVVLAHMSGSSQASWEPFARELAKQGFTAFTFDFRGHGASDKRLERGLVGKDALAAVQFLHAKGYTRVACIGASMGGLACGEAARDAGLVGLALISSPETFGGKLLLDKNDFAGLAYPKLFVVSEGDIDFVGAARTLSEAAPEPKQLQIYSGGQHGTDILASEHGPELQALLIDFIKKLP